MKKNMVFVMYLFTFLMLPLLGYSQVKTEHYPNEDKQQQPPDTDTIQTSSSTILPIKKNLDTLIEKEMIYISVEEQPHFKGDINRYIIKNLKYPEEAIKNNIEGRVALKFVILKTGQIDPSSIEVIRGVGYGINEEAIRILKSMPKFKPAKINGKAVSMHYMLSINFSLQ